MTKRKHTPSDEMSELRRRAEARVTAQAADISDMTADQIRALVHELQVYQVELEIQNEQLRAAQIELAEARDRYRDLYEFAPVGYLSLDAGGVVRNANLTASRILHADRHDIIGKRLETFFATDDHDACYLHLRQAAALDGPTACEFRVPTPDGGVTYAWLETSAIHRGSDTLEGWRVTLHDVTERKLAEQAVVDWTRQFETLAENVPNPVVRIDRRLRHVYVNRKLLEVTGKRRDQFIGRTNREIDDRPEITDPIDELFRRAFVTLLPQQTELSYETPSGTREFDMCVVPEIDADGNVNTVLGIAHDITTHKRIEDALEAAEEEQRRQRYILQGVLDTIPVLLVLWDPRLERFTLNRHCQQVLGWTSEDANAGDFMSKVYPEPDYRGSVCDYMQTLNAGWREFECTTKDGRRIPIEWCNVRLTDETRIGVGVDLRARRQAEQALRDSEEKLRSAFANAAIGFVIRTPDEAFVDANPAYCEITGYAMEELQSLDLSGLIHPDDWDENRRLVERMCAGEVPDFVLENRYLCKDGNIMWVRKSASLVRDAQGDPRWVIVLVEDITDRKQAERELKQLNEALEDRVTERTAQLRLLSDVASAANEAPNLDDALTYVLRRVSEYNGWAFGHAYLPDPDDPDVILPARTWYEARPRRFERFRAMTRGLRLRRGQGMPGRAYDSGRPEWSNDLSADLLERRADLGGEIGLACGAAFPIRAGREVVGVLEFFADHPAEPNEQILETMGTIGTQLGRVFERQRFSHQLSAALLAQQRTIASTLHDSASQQLVGAAMSLELLARQLQKEGREDGESLADLAQAVREAQQTVRDTARGVFPVDDEPGALAAALVELAESVREKHGIGCVFRPEASLDAVTGHDRSAHLYFILSEAVSNAVRHGRPEQITISARQEDGRLTFEVHDDGVGIPEGARHNPGAGLRIMRHRAKLIGADLEVLPADAGGTQVRCRLELE